MRKKKELATYLLIVFVTLFVVALLGGIIAVILLNLKTGKTVTVFSNKEIVVTYTEDEVEEMLADALAQANQEKEEAVEEASFMARQNLLDEIQLKLIGGVSTVNVLRGLYTNQIVLASGGRFHFVDKNPNLARNTYVSDNVLKLENGNLEYYQDGNLISHKGIDVSKFQGKIDWNKVKEDGVEYAFIRVGLRGYGSGKLVEDEFFEDNIKGAISAGVKVGVYFYTQAINEEELLEEANFVLEKIAPYKVECPIVFDVEMTGNDGRMDALSVEERTNLTILFCDTIAAAGYKPMIYHNMEMAVLRLDLEKLTNYEKWFAYYNDDFYYPYDYTVWQYSEKGRVNGITSDVDLNISFKPLWQE